MPTPHLTTLDDLLDEVQRLGRQRIMLVCREDDAPRLGPLISRAGTHIVSVFHPETAEPGDLFAAADVAATSSADYALAYGGGTPARLVTKLAATFAMTGVVFDDGKLHSRRAGTQLPLRSS